MVGLGFWELGLGAFNTPGVEHNASVEVDAVSVSAKWGGCASVTRSGGQGTTRLLFDTLPAERTGFTRETPRGRMGRPGLCRTLEKRP